MSVRRRLRKLIAWAFLLTLAVVVGGAIAAYRYATDSDTLADLVRREAPRFLPGCRVDVTRVRVRPFAGEITLSQLLVRELDGSPGIGPMVARAPWIQVRYDAWAMTRGRFEPREVTVARPRLRLHRRDDGTWNLQGLLADPWPIPRGGAIPPILVQDGTIELAEDGDKPGLTLLRDVAIKIPAVPAGGAPVGFELTAKGEVFDRVRVEGSVEPSTGRVTLKMGELVRLTLSEASRDRLPAEARKLLAQAGLDGGEVDLTLAGLSFDPAATPRLHYEATAQLRRGLWRCSRLPFTISDVSVDLEARDGELTIVRAKGIDGATTLGLEGKTVLGDPAVVAFQLRGTATSLELDGRLRGWIPEKYRDLWDVYFPGVARDPASSAGRVNVDLSVGRASPGAELAVETHVTCLDVSMKYRHFAYPVDHIHGTIHATPRLMKLDLETLVGNRPLHVTGIVENPGPAAVARLKFDVESLPIDAALRGALPDDVRKVVDSFQPTGTVKGRAELVRLPPLKPTDDPRGRVTFDAWVDLNPGCSVTWEGLKYPVMNLVGKLEIHPDLWIFQGMRGANGQAVISAGGRVRQVSRGQFTVDLNLQARNLPFDQQLLDALPKPWRVTWGTLNPTGASDIAATVKIEPGKKDHHRVEIRPRKQTGVKLQIRPIPIPGATGEAPAPFEMRMDDAAGTFVYDTATSPPTSMTDVGFTFHGSPVTFAIGNVDVKDNGEFHLDVRQLEVTGLRLDEGLRRMMPPVMAQFARRLDDRKFHKIQADLGLGWSGKAGESAWCRWENAKVFLIDNKVEVGADLGLEHIQGQLDQLQGSFDGRDLKVHGRADLLSVAVFGQQITDLTADLDVKEGLASLGNIRGSVLGGELTGRLKATLDATPRYSAAVWVREADLQAYAKAMPGHQSFRGLLSGWIDLSGQGYDPHTITGAGGARVVQGDLGTLPVALRFFNFVKLAKDTKTAFDSAVVSFKINNGETTLDPVEFFGNAFSLHGRGTLDVRGNLDLKLRLLAGRDSWHLPLLSDVTRELSGQIIVVRVQGPIGTPSFKPEALPGPGEILRARRQHRTVKRATPESPWHTGLEARLRNGLAARWSRAPE